MALDLENESIVSLTDAARTLPGGSVHISTIHRWRLKGIRGIRLETCLRAGRRVTSREALERFFSRITADADGEKIAQSFARSMRDDFGIADIHPMKVALTGEQVTLYKLPPLMTAKTTSTNYEKFVDQHGQNVFEVEASRSKCDAFSKTAGQ